VRRARQLQHAAMRIGAAFAQAVRARKRAQRLEVCRVRTEVLTEIGAAQRSALRPRSVRCPAGA
jgi:hypothetical protein